MIYADDLLTSIVNSPVSRLLVARDVADTLTSIHRNALSEHYITENQSKLVLRLIKENRKYLGDFEDDINSVLPAPKWRQPFRHIEVVKRSYIDKDDNGDGRLIVEIAHSASVRKDTWDVLKNFVEVTALESNRKYALPLTEVNICKVVDAFKPRGFEISDEIAEHYNTIKSWNADEYTSQFRVDTIAAPNFRRVFDNDVGSEPSELIVRDRSLRYQYNTDVNPSNSALTDQIAFRTDRKHWVSSEHYKLAEVFNSLKELNRLPTIVVFDNWDDEQNFEMLSMLSEAIESAGLTEVGVYFRLQNSEHGKQFNQLIAQQKYNKQLDEKTQVAVVQSGKLPKFFLKNNWQPMSAIALNTRMGLRHGKVSVFLNNTDLILEYAKEPALLDLQIKWP
jgi:hypothetical protein